MGTNSRVFPCNNLFIVLLVLCMTYLFHTNDGYVRNKLTKPTKNDLLCKYTQTSILEIYNNDLRLSMTTKIEKLFYLQSTMTYLVSQTHNNLNKFGL